MAEKIRPSARLFQYCAFLRPTEDEADAGKIGQVIVQPTTILSINEQAASIMASRAIPEEFIGQIDRIEVAVRPF
jgi:hypothetical protein